MSDVVVLSIDVAEGPPEASDDIVVADRALSTWIAEQINPSRHGPFPRRACAPSDLVPGVAVETVVVATDEFHSGPFAVGPAGDPWHIISLLEYSAATCPHVRSGPLDFAQVFYDGDHNSVAVAAVFPPGYVVDDPERWYEQLRDLLFEGTPYGLDGAGALAGLMGAFAVAVTYMDS
jgi:hypothetical protein